MEHSAKKNIPEIQTAGAVEDDSQGATLQSDTDRRAAESYVWDIFMQAPVAICIFKGERHVVQFANIPYLQLLQKDQNFIGKPLFESFPELENQGIKEIIDQVLQSGVSYHANERELQISRNGKLEPGYFNFVYQPYRERDGSITGIIAVVTEVTDLVLARKKVEVSDAFNRTVLESSPDCVKILDIDGRLNYMNVNGLCIMEIDDFKPYKDKFWWELWGAENEPVVKDSLAKALKNESSQFQAFCVTAKGTPKWWDVKVSPVQDIITPGKVTSIISVSRDITKEKIAADKLAESEHRYQEMVYSSPSMIAILKGKEMIIDIANEAILEAWGKGRDVFGKSLLAIMPELVEQGFGDLFHQVYTTGQPSYGYEVPVYIMRKGQRELSYYTFIYQAQRGLNGGIEGLAIIATEVSPQAEFNKNLKESEERFRLLFELLPEKVTNADRDGNVFYFNKSWLDFTGASMEELVNDGWVKWIHPDDRAETSKRWQHSVETGNDFEMELQMANDKGEYKWHLSRAQAVKDDKGKIIMWMGVNTEIQRLKDEEKQKEDFMKMVSHELKTPVTSIKGYVQFLLSTLKEEQLAKLSSLPVKSSLQRVEVQILRLTKLINEILDLSRLKEDKLTLNKELFCLNDLIVETVEDILHTANTHKINVSQEINANIHADKDRIGQVIINILTNAIKYSPISETIEVRVHSGENGQIAVSIKDSGIGIAEADRLKIFDRFYRVEGKSENIFAGFGIGLFIAKEIIERHHGVIGIESETGKGSTFTFCLPYQSDELMSNQPVLN